MGLVLIRKNRSRIRKTRQVIDIDKTPCLRYWIIIRALLLTLSQKEGGSCPMGMKTFLVSAMILISSLAAPAIARVVMLSLLGLGDCVFALPDGRQGCCAGANQ
ncbi:MAG: hypothetical protein DSY90_01620 [Deltaproteobacteria bacterium]|nr:MAG: hypothetical protein DSY90_01620 [Deltaproteobacteria bacterium]